MPGGLNDADASTGGQDDTLPEDGVRRDVRLSRHEDLGVHVTRNLGSQGRLARGDNTNMSRMSFRVEARPREERDPELEALREPGRQAVPPASESDVTRPLPSQEDRSAESPPAKGAFSRVIDTLFRCNERA